MQWVPAMAPSSYGLRTTEYSTTEGAIALCMIA